jgi:hypothetical protein
MRDILSTLTPRSMIVRTETLLQVHDDETSWLLLSLVCPLWPPTRGDVILVGFNRKHREYTRQEEQRMARLPGCGAKPARSDIRVITCAIAELQMEQPSKSPTAVVAQEWAPILV